MSEFDDVEAFKRKHNLTDADYRMWAGVASLIGVDPITVKAPVQQVQDRQPATTGGPAFPVLINGINSEMPGMTMRDYFAAKAMEATIKATLVYATEHAKPNVPSDSFADTVAQGAYAFSDAMLKERAK